MAVQLTEGCIATIMSGGQIDSPVMQILGHKRIQGSGTDRFRLLVSDGRHIHSFAMLATQLNGKAISGELENNTIVRIDRFICNVVNSGNRGEKRVMIILDLTVVARGADVGGRIGNPVQLTEGATAQPQAAPLQNAQPLPPRPATNAAPQLQRPQLQQQMSSPRMGTGPVSQTHPIASLTPYQNRWTIKVRVANKSDIRTWSNSRGEGKLFNVTLMDESGEIRATAFREQVDKFYDMLETNKVYYISRGTLKTANKQYSSIQNDYEMTFNNETQIVPCHEESGNIPLVSFNFVSIPQLEQLEKDSIIDLIGICKTAADVSTVVTRTTNRELKKRDIQLVDSTNTEVTLTLWGTQAENFDGSTQPVLAVKGARLSDFGGRSVSLLSASILQINPDIKEAHKLRGWFDNGGISMTSQSISSGRGAQGSGVGYGSEWLTFRDVKTAQMGGGDKADYYSCKATVVMIRKENSMYMACPTSDCNKKVVDMNNGMYRCEKCNREFPEYKWRLLLSVNLADYTDNQWVTCFQDCAESLLNATADELGRLKDEDHDAFQNVFQVANFQSYLFRLRVKMETYNDESRLKTTVFQAQPISFEDYNRKLIAEIKEMGGQMS